MKGRPMFHRVVLWAVVCVAAGQAPGASVAGLQQDVFAGVPPPSALPDTSPATSDLMHSSQVAPASTWPSVRTLYATRRTGLPRRRTSLFSGSLTAKLVADVVAAAVSSFCVSPFISIVDRSIIQSASGAVSMRASIALGVQQMMIQPLAFAARPDFLATWALYGATYLMANVISTVASEANRPMVWHKFFGTTAVNMPGSIFKDQALTKMFGAMAGAAAPGPLPGMSFALFTVRDVATMAASFSLPTPMSSHMQHRMGLERSWADGLSQLLSPGLMQFFSTPVHMLGIFMYTNPGASMSSVVRSLSPSRVAPCVALRFGRIGAAFGIGGVGNNTIRERLRAILAPPPPPAAVEEAGMGYA